MEAIREIRTVEQEEVILRLPKRFWGRQVEIIVLSRSLNRPRLQKRSLLGCLQSYARPELISTESNAWLEAMEDKYAPR